MAIKYVKVSLFFLLLFFQLTIFSQNAARYFVSDSFYLEGKLFFDKYQKKIFILPDSAVKNVKTYKKLKIKYKQGFEITEPHKIRSIMRLSHNYFHYVCMDSTKVTYKYNEMFATHFFKNKILKIYYMSFQDFIYVINSNISPPLPHSYTIKYCN
jgi:hypothetical protein